VKDSQVSKLTKALAVVSLLAPATALPLSIGDIALHSALNQRLRADVRLQLVGGENPGDVMVRLAAPEKFDQAGIPWNYFLSQLQFKSVVEADGSVTVKISSKEVLTEPFLNFLLEVSWPQGSQYREFTLLVDPPSDVAEPRLAKAASAADASDAMVDSAIANRRARSAAAASASLATDGEYGPTQPSDTLWSIATLIADERGLPVRELLNALYQANPGAFNRGDKDSLKSGVILKIPTAAALQTAAAKSSIPQSRAEKTSKKVAAAAPASRLELLAPTEASANAAASRSQAASAATAVVGQAGSADKAVDMQAQVNKLQQELTMMQQLLALKDQQLAALQAPDKAAAAVPAVAPIAQPVVESAPQAAAPVAAPAMPPSAPAPAVTPEPKPAPVVSAPAVAAAPAVDDSDNYYTWVAGIGFSVLGVLGWLQWRKRRIDAMSDADSMFASASQIRMPDADTSQPLVMPEQDSTMAFELGAMGDSSFISEFSPSDLDMFDSQQNEVDPLAEADVYLAYGRYKQSEELIRVAISDHPHRDDYKLKLLEVLAAADDQTGFIDYCRSLAQAGMRDDFIFWDKVVELATELLPDLTAFNDAVAVSAIAEPPAAAVAVPDTLDDSVYTLNFEDDDLDGFDGLDLAPPADLALLDSLEAQMTTSADKSDEGSHPTEDNGLAFDLDFLDQPAVAEKPVVNDSDSDANSIEFAVESLSVDTASAAAAEAKTVDVAVDVPEPFAFEFTLDDEKTTAPAQQVLGDEGLDFDHLLDMDAFDLSEETKPKAAELASESPSKASDSFDEFDFTFDFDSPLLGEEDHTALDASVTDLTDNDELETKMDLAKAYLDMGDGDSARTIAQQVLAQGSAAQKQAAQALLDQLL
jgi:pilus assembly protein FimV